MATLKGITWNHSRGYVSAVAAAQRFSELNPGVDIRWEKRSLKEFGDAPVGELARQCDLLVIDHPWAGFAVRNKIVLPLEQYLDKSFLEGQRSNSVGRSYESYGFDGYQSALPIDAAAPVAAYREGWFESQKQDVPRTWEDVLKLAEKGLVICAGDPTNILMQFYMFGNSLTDTLFVEGRDEVIDAKDGEMVLEQMRSLASRCPEYMYRCDPIRVYELLAGESPWIYTPFEFGYSNYSRDGYGKHPVISSDVVTFGEKPLHTVLGGTGIAVSAKSQNRETALAFVTYATLPEIQSTLYFDAGGQPGHRAAWLDPEVNRRSRGFFARTLNTLEKAYLRPRYDGYLYFQDRAGAILRDYLQTGGSVTPVLAKLNSLYRKSKSGM